MKGKALLVALILLSLVLPKVSATSAEGANITLTCSPLIVKVVDSNYGLKFIAEGTCRGYAVNKKNTTLTPVYEVIHVNVTGPFYGEYRSTLHVKNGLYKPGDRIPVELYLRTLYSPLDLIPWVLRHDSTNVSLSGTLWLHPLGTEKNAVVPIDIRWKGTVPVEVDWPSVLSGTLLVTLILPGILLGFVGSLAVKGKKIKNTLWNAGLLFGWLVVPIVASTGPETQLGSFVVVEFLFTAVWFSSVSYALYPVLPKPVKTPGNIALALYFATVVFSFAWAMKTGNSGFVLGALILVVLFGILLTNGIQRGLDELKVKGERISPESLGVLSVIGYIPFLLLWGGVLKSVKLTLFGTTVLGISLLSGLLMIKHYREKRNIQELANVY